MNCARIKELLVAHLDGELSFEEQERIQDHLSTCTPCRDELSSLDIAQDKLRQVFRLRAGGILPSPQTWSALRRRVQSSHQPGFPEKLWNLRRKWLWGAATAEACALLVAVAVIIRIGMPDRTPPFAAAPAAVTPAGEQSIEESPHLEIMEPADNAVVRSDLVDIKGKTDPGAVVSVNDEIAIADDQGYFSISLGLDPGLNIVLVSTSNDSGQQVQATTITSLGRRIGD